MNTGLDKWTKIRAEIANCDDIDKLSKMSYTLEVVQKWAKESKQILETQNDIAEARLRVDVKRGKWVKANIPKEGGNPTDQLAKFGRLVRPTLSEAGYR